MRLRPAGVCQRKYTQTVWPSSVRLSWGKLRTISWMSAIWLRRRRWPQKVVEASRAMRASSTVPAGAISSRLVQCAGRAAGSGLGWLQYYAVPTSYRSLGTFVYQVKRIWMWMLRRRSQKDRFSWERLERICQRLWPGVKIVHPWPTERFPGITGGRSRMR